MNAIVRLPHPWRGDSQDQETFLAPSADNQALNYDKECSNHQNNLFTSECYVQTIPSSKWRQPGLANVLAPSADKQTFIYSTERSNHHLLISTPESKALFHSKMKW